MSLEMASFDHEGEMVSFPAPPWPRKPEEFPQTLAHFVSDDEVEGGRARARDEIRLRHAKRAEADDFERAAPRGKTVVAPPAACPSLLLISVARSVDIERATLTLASTSLHVPRPPASMLAKFCRSRHKNTAPMAKCGAYMAT